MRRSFATDLELRADGREIWGRIVPFGERATVVEMDADGMVERYEEEFLPGCTVRMQQVARRARNGKPSWIKFTVDHEQTFDARLGFCTELSEQNDGAYGTFTMYEGPQLAKARSMLAESHGGLSIEFVDVAPPLVNGDLRQRRQINIDAVTATPVPVYASASILALRADAPGTIPALGSTPNLDAVAALLAELRGGAAASPDVPS